MYDGMKVISRRERTRKKHVRLAIKGAASMKPAVRNCVLLGDVAVSSVTAHCGQQQFGPQLFHYLSQQHM